VHGVDRDSAALGLCTTRLREAGAEATLVRQAMNEVNLPFRYAAAYAGRGTFQWLDATAAREALHRLRAHLLPPARLLLELLVPPPALLRLAAPLVELRTARLADGTRIALRSETHADADARTAWSHNRYVHRRGTRHLGEASESATRTWYSREDIAQLLDEQGFVDVAFSAAPASEPDGEAFRVSARAE
jgi:hypothetical protein